MWNHQVLFDEEFLDALKGRVLSLLWSYKSLLLMLWSAPATGIANVVLWLQGDLQPPEIDFRSSPNNGHSKALNRTEISGGCFV